MILMSHDETEPPHCPRGPLTMRRLADWQWGRLYCQIGRLTMKQVALVQLRLGRRGIACWVCPTTSNLCRGATRYFPMDIIPIFHLVQTMKINFRYLSYWYLNRISLGKIMWNIMWNAKIDISYAIYVGSHKKSRISGVPRRVSFFFLLISYRISYIFLGYLGYQEGLGFF